ncbi:MAG: hypothetical protein ACI9HK_005218 [Pirellulaceae bacterium]|jgi:hypothetical protein
MGRIVLLAALVHLCVLALGMSAHGESKFPRIGERLSDEQVAQFAELALAGIDREYPNKPSNVMADRASVQSPQELHPVFYGSFDWHSSVHGHWMLIRLVKQYPKASVASKIRSTLNRRFTADGLKAEAAYFDAKYNRSFERMYGWAWTLRLAGELHLWDDADGRKWAANFKPLEAKIVALIEGYLPKLDWPIRCGFHPESSFALAFFLDYARTVENKSLEKLLVKKSRQFYLADKEYPASYEPSGNDFFSPGLNEADLMRRVLPTEEYSRWLDQFFPNLRDGRCGNLLTPVEVSDPTDGHLVHLAGLNLNRAWTMAGIHDALKDASDPRKKVLQKSADEHAEAGMRYVFSGHYEGEHWLASFAIYALSGS